MAIITQPLAISYIHNCVAFSFSSTQQEWVELKRDGVSFFNQQITPVADVVSVNLIDQLLSSFTTSGHVINNVVVTDAESIISIITQEFGTIQFTARTGVVGTGASITIQQQPNAYNFAFDCKDLIINTELETIISFQQNGILFLEEKYFPYEGIISIKLKDILNQLLYTAVPNIPLFVQTTQFSTFSIILPTETISFKAMAGGRGTEENADPFFKNNFLTNRPQITAVDKVTPIYLSYLRVPISAIIVKGYKSDNTVIQTEISMLTSNNIYTFSCTYSSLLTLFNVDELKAVDINVLIGDEPPFTQSNPFRFIFSRQTLPFDDIFLFENTFGSIEAIVFEGILEEIQNHKSISYKIDDITHEFRNDFSRSFKKNTGIFKNEAHRKWSSEFFSSKKRYHLVNGTYKEIYVNSIDAKSVKFDLNDFSFDFSYSEDSRHYEITRASSLPAL